MGLLVARLATRLEERGVPKALSDKGSAGREGRAYVVLLCFFFDMGFFFEPPNE
jgi:hypothetical protein